MGKGLLRPRGTVLPPPTQDHLHVRAVLPPGYLIADDGTISATLEVAPVDLALAGEAEIIARQEQFAAFVAGLHHELPIQVVIATVPQRCEEYRDRVDRRIARLRELAEEARRTGDTAAQERREHMRELAEAHKTLFEALLEQLHPREERYLVTVWHNPFPLIGSRGSRKRMLSSSYLEEGKQEVERRLTAIAGQLQHIGLSVRRLGVDELTNIIHDFYSMPASPLARALPPAILAGEIAFEE